MRFHTVWVNNRPSRQADIDQERSVDTETAHGLNCRLHHQTASNMTDIFQGSCLCGAVKYEIQSRPKVLSHCHCSQCRKSHGAAFASYGSVLRSDLHLVQGADGIKSYPSSESVLRQFCAECGSSLFWSRSQGAYAEWISIAMGTLDSTFTSDKQKHIEVVSKATWYEIQDHWPQSK
ncbi:hypothetical protein QFZ84_001071 [Pseudomonas fluorescens]